MTYFCSLIELHQRKKESGWEKKQLGEGGGVGDVRVGHIIHIYIYMCTIAFCSSCCELLWRRKDLKKSCRVEERI